MKQAIVVIFTIILCALTERIHICNKKLVGSWIRHNFSVKYTYKQKINDCFFIKFGGFI